MRDGTDQSVQNRVCCRPAGEIGKTMPAGRYTKRGMSSCGVRNVVFGWIRTEETGRA